MSVNVVHIFDVSDYQKQIAEAARRLRAGEVIVLPTETVYGAAGLLNQSSALEKLRALRAGSGRRAFTIHVASEQQAMQYLGETPELGKRMMKKLWPGPVGLMFDVPESHQREVAARIGVNASDLYENGGITLRCPDHPVAADVLAGVDGPVALTLADRTQIKPLEGKVDLVLDAGPTRFSRPSTIVRVKRAGWEIVRAGVYDHRIIERMLHTTVLFVCSGNTCRSPMAEAIARKVIADHLKIPDDALEARGISVMSAGSFAMAGARATPQGVEAVKALGADLSRHRSRPLSVELIHQADVIFAMGRAHLQTITALVPAASEKTMLLDPNGDIEDPIGGDASLYDELAASLHKLIEKRLRDTIFKNEK